MIYGFIKSKLTGKESKFKTEKQNLPKEFKYKLPKVLDQGAKPICTACASHAFLNWEYHKDFNLDTIFKNSKPQKEGAELKNVFEYLKSQKLINDYAIIGSEQALKTAILLNGPCIGALPVYNNSETFWKGSSLQGGHAIAITGWDTDGFIIRNSWGGLWGYNGYTILPYEDINRFYELWTLIK